jgi:hypothetical protein
VAYDVRSNSTVTGTGTTMTLSVPAGTTRTDSIYAVICHAGNIRITPPYGWTFATDNAFSNCTIRVMRLQGDPTSGLTAGPWTFPFLDVDGVTPIGTPYAGTALAVTRDDAVVGATPVVPDVFAAAVTSPLTSPAVPPTVTPANSGDVLMYAVGWFHATTFTPPAGVTERADVRSGNTSADLTMWVGTKANATTAGVTTSSVSVTNDNPFSMGSTGYAMVTVALFSGAPPSSWVGDFETGDFSQYAFVLRAATDRVSIQTDTPRQGTKYARLTAQDGDVYPLTPTDNPRASLVSPRILYPGFERWISFSVRFPLDFPTIPPDGWFVWMQYHGPPYAGSPSVGFGVAGDNMNIERNQTYDYDAIWSSPLQRGQWVDFVLRVNFQQDETGYIEMWMNQVQQTFKGGVRRLYMRTVEADQNDGLELDPVNYRKRGILDTATVDHDNVKFEPTVPSSITSAIQIAAPVSVFGGATADPTVVAELGGQGTVAPLSVGRNVVAAAAISAGTAAAASANQSGSRTTGAVAATARGMAPATSNIMSSIVRSPASVSAGTAPAPA